MIEVTIRFESTIMGSTTRVVEASAASVGSDVFEEVVGRAVAELPEEDLGCLYRAVLQEVVDRGRAEAEQQRVRA